MRLTLFCLVVCGILADALVLDWTPLQQRRRAGRIKQCKLLEDRVSLQIDELYRQSDAHFEVSKNPLYIRCHYMGSGIPYGYAVALLASPDGPRLDYQNVVECALPFKGDGHPVL